MKKFKKLPFKVFLLSMIIGLLLTISIGFSIWLITDRIEIHPNLEVGKIITQYLDGQDATYDGNIFLPSSKELGWNVDSDELEYSFKRILDSDGEPIEGATAATFTPVTEGVGPIVAGTYSIKVVYLLQSDTTNEIEEYEKIVTFVIHKATIDMSTVRFKDVESGTNIKTVTYDTNEHTVEIDETTLPKEITGVTYKLEDGTEFTGAVNATESPYTVIASFTYNTANYNIVDDMTATLIINRKDINDEDILKVFLNYPDNTFYYTGNDLSEIESSLTVSFDKYVLTQNKEYTVSFIDILEVGDYTETIIGIGNYTGEATISYKIVKKQLIISISEDSSIYNAQLDYYFFDYTKGGVNFNKFIKIYNSQNEEITDAKISYKYKIDDNKPREFEDGFPINVGYYWVEITAAHNDYENCTEKKQFIINSLDISKAIITVSTEPKIVYDGNEQKPSYTVTYDGEPLIAGVDFLFVRWVDNINAGKASVIIQGKGNFDTNTECSGEFTIHKATPTIILTPTLSKKKLIEGENVEITENSGKATHNNIEVPGNFTSNVSNYITTETNSIIPMLSFPEDEKAASAVVGVNVTFKFTPNDTRNYEVVTIQNVDVEDSPPTYTMYAVAYNSVSAKYYGTIEKALDAASESEKVWVLPDIYIETGFYPTIRTFEKTKNSTVTVKSGVTFVLTYASEDFTTGYKVFSNKEAYVAEDKSAANGNAAQAIVAENMILKVENGGNLTIGAWVGANCSVGKHAVLMNKGIIELDSGATTYVYGYIKGEGEFHAKSGSTVHDLMMIYDFAGARYAGGMYFDKLYVKATFSGISISEKTTYNNIMPFQSFSIHNISCETKIYKGSTYNLRTQLNISNEIHTNNIILFGTKGMFELTSDKGYVIRNVVNTTGDLDINGDDSWNSSNQDSTLKGVYDFHSNVTDHSISVSLEIAIVTATITTGKSVALPIGMMDINIKNGFTMNITTNSYKFLPGSKVTVDEGAVLNIGSEKIRDLNVIFYDEYYDDYICKNQDGNEIAPDSKNSFSYYSKHKFLYNDDKTIKDKYKSKIIVNGTLNCYSNLGGVIESTSDTGTVVLSSGYATLNKLKEISYWDVDTSDISGLVDKLFNGMQLGGIVEPQSVDAKMHLYNGNTIDNGTTSVLAGEYHALKIDQNEDGEFIVEDGEFGWYTSKLNISYDLNGGQGVSVPEPVKGKNALGGYIVDNDDLPDISTVYREGYIFKNQWATDPEGKNIVVPGKTVLYANTVFYAVWEVEEYEIHYENIYDNEMDNIRGNEFDTNPNTDIGKNYTTYTVEDVINLTTPTLSVNGQALKFGGWFTDKSCEEEFRVNVIEKLTGNIILYAYWYSADTITINIDYNVSIDSSVDSSKIPSEIKPNSETAPIYKGKIQFTPTNNSNLINNNTDIDGYFDGWYLDLECKIQYATNISVDEYLNGNTLTLYGKVIKKATVTINYNGGEKNSNTGLDSGVYYFAPGSNLPLPDLKKDGAKHSSWNVDASDVVSISQDNKSASVKSVGTATITAQYKLYRNVTIENASDKEVTIKVYIDGEYDNDKSREIGASQFYTFSVLEGKKVKVLKEDDTEIIQEQVVGDKDISGTIKASSSGGSCLAEGTLITMADGTKIKVEDIKAGDKLLVFNHETGKYDIAEVLFNDSEDISTYTVINLEFSNNSIVKVISEHGFFDLDLMKYVYINEYNYKDYIGHRFVSAVMVNGKMIQSIVTLDNAYLTEEYIKVYSPVTKYHMNYLTEDILSMPGGISGLFNIFEYDDNLQYNQELMEKDIKEYGLFTYEDFKDLVSYEIYSSFATQYFKVAIAKGYLTWEQLYYYIERYGPLV